MIKNTFESLRKGGYIIFLSTPNSESLLYKLKKDLPNLNFPLNRPDVHISILMYLAVLEMSNKKLFDVKN